MDESEDSVDVRENDPALAGWYAYRARVRNMANRICETYGLRDPDWFQDRLLMGLENIKDARRGRHLAVAGETASFVTLRDEEVISDRKKAAVRLRDLLIDERAGFGFTPETHFLRVSLTAYLEHLDTIEFRRRKGSGRHRGRAYFLVRQLSSRCLARPRRLSTIAVFPGDPGNLRVAGNLRAAENQRTLEQHDRPLAQQ